MSFRSPRRIVWIGLSVVIALTSSRLLLAQPPAEATSAKSPSFSAEIQPLLKEKCWKCHGFETQKGELALHTPALIEKGSESGAVVLPGNSAGSRLFEVVKHGEMPPDQKGTLSESEVELIRRWIDEGASFGQDTTTQPRAATQHDVIPILLLRCTVCHGRHQQSGGLDLRDRAAMLKGGKSGPAIVLGQPDNSLLLKRVRAEEMPPHQRLTEVSVKPMEPEEIKTIARWIEAGAPLAEEPPDLAATPQDPLVRQQDKEFWAFQPPQIVAIPPLMTLPNGSVTNPVRSPIDVLIAQQLQAKSLSLSESADRATLLRRLTFDLTGLPPTPEETNEFLGDDSVDAYERLIDRLLASPRYGERWGTHWLGVAGYADCEGRREQHLPRPAAWRYRDYVIRSLNDDKPYNRFLLEQIAGDELTDYEHAPRITQEVEDNLVATAFLRMAPDPTWANLTGFVPDRLEVTADSIDVLTAGVMGMTFKCARCHTHKFDPIPQRDYYRLVAIFKGAYDEHDWLKPQLKSYGGAMSAGMGERFLPYVTTDERQRWETRQAEIQKQLDELAKLPSTPESTQKIKDLEAKRQPEPRIMALWDRGEPSPTYMYRRGNYLTPGSYVAPGVPSVLNDDKPFEITAPWPGAKSTGRRLAFARWLTTPQHPLTARVMVNRIWKHHFGQGIVRSLGNFGKTGDRPTHPELLDYLALDFIRRDWSIKFVHRQLVSTATYRQSSSVPTVAKTTDSANGSLSRMPLQRLDAEQLRDAIAMIAGELIESGGGPSEPVHIRGDGLVLSGRRRSIYAEQLRKHPPSLMESFDLPAMNPNCLQRSDSLVPTQALHLWNDTAIRRLAGQFADRVWQTVHERNPDASDAESITEVYRIALTRTPRPEELEACTFAFSQLRDQWQSSAESGNSANHDDASRRALTTLCHTILNSADFLYLD